MMGWLCDETCDSLRRGRNPAEVELETWVLVDSWYKVNKKARNRCTFLLRVRRFAKTTWKGLPKRKSPQNSSKFSAADQTVCLRVVISWLQSAKRAQTESSTTSSLSFLHFPRSSLSHPSIILRTVIKNSIMPYTKLMDNPPLIGKIALILPLALPRTLQLTQTRARNQVSSEDQDYTSLITSQLSVPSL